MEASTHGIQIEPEPREWRLRNLSVAARLWCGAVSFFFAAFVFAFFYLHALNTDHGWKIGNVSPSGGLGVAIMCLFVLSAVLMYLSAHRPEADTLPTAVVALVLVLLGVALQFFEYSTLGFGPASGGYASVFFGWTATYAAGALGCAYWIEINVATLWRGRTTGLSTVDQDVTRANLSACSLFWAYYAVLGVIAYIILYLV